MADWYDGRGVPQGGIAWGYLGEVVIGTCEGGSISSRLSRSFVWERGQISQGLIRQFPT